MAQSLLFTTVSVLLLFCFVVHAHEEAENERKILPEDECLRAGGFCVHVSKCPSGKINKEVECSKQKELGAVCCHSAHDPAETRCEMLAGECKDECADNLKVAQAQNCPAHQTCCTLV